MKEGSRMTCHWPTGPWQSQASSNPAPRHLGSQQLYDIFQTLGEVYCSQHVLISGSPDTCSNSYMLLGFLIRAGFREGGLQSCLVGIYWCSQYHNVPQYGLLGIEGKTGCGFLMLPWWLYPTTETTVQGVMCGAVSEKIANGED